MAFDDDLIPVNPHGFSDDDIPVIGDAMLHPDVNFEAGMSSVPPISIALIVACMVAFGCQLLHGSLDDLNNLKDLGALDPARVKEGQLWRLISPIFLHANFDHILGNLIMLYILGIGCEHAFGRLQFLTLYVVAGICGSLLSLVDGRVSVGASGAIFGLAGALVTCLWWNRHKLHVRDRRIGLLIVVWAAFQLFIGAFTPHIDNYAHLGGFLSGSVLGILMPVAVLEGKSHVNTLASSRLGLAFTSAALVYTAVFFLPRLLGS